MLGALARAIGVAGADIVKVEVLEHSLTHAVDDFVLELPSGRDVGELTVALSGLLGAQVLALHPAADSTGHPDLDLLAALAANPARGLVTCTDMLPAVFRATWALSVVSNESGVQVVHRGVGVPPYAPSLPVAPPGHRARALTAADAEPLSPGADEPAAGAEIAACPIGRSPYTVLIGRDLGPAFHPVELFRLECLAAVVERMLALTSAMSRP